jgi:chromosome partitioning protein
MIILVGTEKGGTGKTTIAVNLAAMRAAKGKDVLLVDSDKQGSATLWAQVRVDEGVRPSLTCVSKLGPTAGFDIVQMANKFDTVIVDAGGRDSSEMRNAMLFCDHMIIPTKPSQFDTWTFDVMDRLVIEARARGNTELAPIVVINMANPNPQVREAEEAADAINSYESMRVAKAVICDRIPFRKAARDGRAVTELKEGDTEKAIIEIRHLYREVFG